MARVFEYFVVCGIGPEIRTLDGSKGYHGPEYYYLSSVLDQFPPLNHSLYTPPPPQLSTVSVSLFFFFFCFSQNIKNVFQKLFLVFLRFLQCVLPAGVQFYSSGFDSDDPSTFPRTYPIVLTGILTFIGCLCKFCDFQGVLMRFYLFCAEGDGSKIYVSCISFRDPVSEDIAEAYRIPANSFADKCICLVSRSPSFRILRNALEEIYSLCFLSDGSR